jgi:predicted Rdx family selenoprotein
MKLLNWGLPTAALLVVLLAVVFGGSSAHDATRQALAPSAQVTPPVDDDTDGTGISDPKDTAPRAANQSSPPAKPPESATRTTVAPAAKAKRRKSSLVACDANIKVKGSTTTCAFAQNVFYGYWLNEEEPGVFADSPGIPAYSPAAGTTFDVDCAGGSKIVCRTSDGGYVTFPVAAVDAYTVANAEQYAASHELGDVPPPSGRRPDPGQPVAGDGDGGNCDPNYEGACLDPAAYDYDCEGGSGDGPKYTGPVEVVGSDPYELDRDGDGIACAF